MPQDKTSVIRRSIRSVNAPSPFWAFEILQIGLFKFPSPNWGQNCVQMPYPNARFDGERVYSAEKTWHFPSHPDKIKIPHPRARMTVKLPDAWGGGCWSSNWSTLNGEYCTTGRTETSLQGLENNYQRTESFCCDPDMFLSFPFSNMWVLPKQARLGPPQMTPPTALTLNRGVANGGKNKKTVEL